jgi:nitrogen PTS system EIIA component
MNLAQFFDPDLVDIDLKAQYKFEAVSKLVDLFCKKYPDKDKQAILKAVAQREDLGSTSFGRGFAFPHARTDVVTDLFIAFGIVNNGVLDKSPDNIPIKGICLLLTPRNISKLYLQTLSGLANFARRPGILDQVASVRSTSELIKLIEESEIDVKKALTVADIMSHNVVTVLPDEPLRHVANIMFKYNFDGVPVVDSNGIFIGDVSGKELLKSALPDYEKVIANHQELEPFEELLRHEDHLLVKDVMKRDVAIISEDALAVEAAAKMLSRNVERIMVVKDGRLVGVISASDIISKIIRG